MEKCYPRRGSNPQSHDYRADALPTEPRLLKVTLVIIAECDRNANAAMQFTANKNVALPASTITNDY